MDCFASDSVIYFTSVKRTLFDPLTISARSAASCWLQGLEIEEIINMRKITRRSFLTAAAACGAAAALSACGGSSSASSSAAASSTVASASVAAASNGEKFTVGICQLVQHAALDAATQGFEDALTASFGENVTFDFQNAQGDSATCATIANGFVSSGVALIMANATPALQAAQAATNTIPILGTSVTEYGVALGLDNFSGTVGGRQT